MKQNMAKDSVQKVVILGSGCAGYTAAIYTARANLFPLLICGYEEGGQLMLTTEVENFPGFPEGIIGPELMERLKKQSEKFGTKCLTGKVTGFNVLKNGLLEIEVGKEKIKSVTVIVATGASARWLGLPSEKKFQGRGIHTCATCDGFFYKDKEIIVIGGGDSACEEASFLTKHAKKVTIVHRKDTLRASKIMQDRVFKNKMIDFIWDTVIEDIKGDKVVNTVVLKNLKTNKLTEKKIDGIFLAIGHVPNTDFLKGKVKLDDHGFIITDNRLKTNVAGVFACGDVQDPRYKQAVTAAGTGCQAALEAERYYEEHKK